MSAVPGCTVEPGNVCLSCDGQGMSAQLCDDTLVALGIDAGTGPNDIQVVDSTGGGT
ncbi:hypothetical protein [Nannocystis sp.]|uniref:hypothetical protein n=1 Tax=Nannocystis sp. TaxID=1962667 RepID=UPI0024251608|nr:hypothetical protein [Nannocystis sp.]MBK7826250.1 hypothetical protein [Nannocystis sp.]MBK9758237.1 hypothetical protein [Nannocystis sp.]